MALSTENTPELTREVVAAMLTEPLERFATFLSAGPRFFDTDGGNSLRIPANFASKAENIQKNNWHGQNEKITEVDPDLADELELLPSTMKSIKTLTRFSNELARQSVVALDQALQNRLVTDVAKAIDMQLLGATGDGIKRPKGMFAWDKVTELEYTELDLDTVMDAYGVFLGERGHTENLTLFMRPDDYMTLRKLKDGDGRYLLQPDMSTGGIIVPALGATARISNHIPQGQSALVDMDQVAVARDIDPSVRILSETFGDYDQQAIRVVARYDVGLMDDNAMVKLVSTGDGE